MRSTKYPKSITTSKRPGASGSRSWIRSEWPLLLYPVLVAAALVALYVANRPTSQEPSPLGRARLLEDTRSGKSSGPADGVQNEQRASVHSTDPNWTGEGRATLAGVHDKQHAISDSGRMTVGLSQQTSGPSVASPAFAGNEPPGAGRIIGLLRRAVQTHDQAALKNCLDQLVALGDQSVAPLSDFLARGEDGSCVWAAEALARIGTPAATLSLLDALSQMTDGPYKEQIAKRVSNISNHDSWPILLDAMQTTQDAAVRRAASMSLSRMADAPIVDELVARYDAAATIDEAADLARTVGSISSPKAAEPLLALAKQIPSVPEDPLDQSILDAIANVGDAQCVSYLLTQLEACAPGEGAYMMSVISKISQPQAETSLLYAAAGNKEVSAEQGRTAAILALKNFPSERTYVLLEQIASTEQNAAVASAAARTLATIQRASPMLAANAQVKPDEQILLPANISHK